MWNWFYIGLQPYLLQNSAIIEQAKQDLYDVLPVADKLQGEEEHHEIVSLDNGDCRLPGRCKGVCFWACPSLRRVRLSALHGSLPQSFTRVHLKNIDFLKHKTAANYHSL